MTRETASLPGTRVSDFEYRLPAGRIAAYPAARRDESGLLCLERESGRVEHHVFRDIVDLVDPGDVLVVNESRVLPARLLGVKPTGAPAEILLVRPFGMAHLGEADGGDARPAAKDGGELWEALVRPGGKLKPGRRVIVAPELEVDIVDSTADGGRVVRLVTPLGVAEALERFGHVPLPPYIGRDDEPMDRERYQTVYARRPGSVAAPTAGLHFTEETLAALSARGVARARITLHVGAGTFRPVGADDPREHRMHEEWYSVPEGAARAINEARARGGMIWAVGTTVARTLESVADAGGRVRSGSGATRLFIHPPYRFRAIDRLITNFHLPRSTLLMLVAAFAGYDQVMEAYRVAIGEGYRFYSYGDAMVIR